MREYDLVELIDGSKCVIIDALEYQSTKYFLLAPTSNDEEYISDEFEICIYNEEQKYFEEIIDEDQYNLIKVVFEQRLEMQKNEINLLDKIDNYDMVKLEVVDIDTYNNYTFKDSQGNIKEKNIEFIGLKLPIGTKVYMSENILKEINIFTYGIIYDYNKINLDEVIRVEIEDKKYYLQRYYG